MNEKILMNIMQKTAWIQTHNGISFTPLNPKLKDIKIEDIAHALGHICRFCGHSKVFYSVAEHSVLCAEQAPDRLKLATLLHDASEAYIADISRPIKPFLTNYKDIEDVLTKAINKAFNIELSEEDEAIIKNIDMRMLATEATQLLEYPPDNWSIDLESLKYNDLDILGRNADRYSFGSVFMDHFKKYSNIA